MYGIVQPFVQGYHELGEFSNLWLACWSMAMMLLFGMPWGGIMWKTFFIEGRYFFGLFMMFITYMVCSATWDAIAPQDPFAEGPWAFALCVFNSTVVCIILFLVFQRRDVSKNPVRTPEQEAIVSAALIGTTAYLIHKRMKDD